MALDNVMAIVDVVDFEVQDYATRDLLFSVDYAEEVKLLSNAESFDIKAGIGAPVRLTIDHSKTAEFNTVLPLIDINALGIKLGRKVAKGPTRTPMSELLLVGAASEVPDLKFPPISGSIKVYLLETNGRDVKHELTATESSPGEKEYKIEGQKITVNSAIEEGKYLKVLYDYSSGVSARLMRVTASDFPGYLRITGRGYALDESGNKAPVAFACYRCKPTSDFEITFRSNEATSIPFNCKMAIDLIGTDQVYFDIIPLPDESAVSGDDAAAPVILGDLKDVTAVEQDIVILNALSMSPDGGTISYQWFSADDETGADENKLSEQTNATYLVDTSAINTYYYFCKVTNTNSSVSGSKTTTIRSRVVTVDIGS